MKNTLYDKEWVIKKSSRKWNNFSSLPNQFNDFMLQFHSYICFLDSSVQKIWKISSLQKLRHEQTHIRNSLPKVKINIFTSYNVSKKSMLFSKYIL